MPPHVLVIDDKPWLLGLEDWEDVGVEGTWEVCRHPSNLPTSFEKFDGILLDHRMPCKTGDQVLQEILAAGFPLDLVIGIGSLRQGVHEGYPKDFRWIGGVLSGRVLRPLFKFFAEEGDWEEVVAAKWSQPLLEFP